jgi:Phosphotransferase enzyme family
MNAIGARQVKELLSSYADCSVKGPLLENRQSRIFYAECADFPSALAVKLFLDPATARPDTTTAAQQFRALQRVHEKLGKDSALSVPEPYFLMAESGLVGIEWVAGKSMTQLLFSWRCSANQAIELVSRAARWLRQFHCAHALPARRLDVEDKLVAVSEMDAFANARDPVFRRSVAVLGATAAAAGAEPLPTSWIHGDFKSDNLLVAGPRTLAIDVHVKHENVVLYDVAPFVNHLELGCYHPQGWRLALYRDNVSRNFVDHYFESPITGGILLPLLWVRLYLLLAGWCALAPLGASGLRQQWLWRSFRRVTATVLAKLEAWR